MGTSIDVAILKLITMETLSSPIIDIFATGKVVILNELNIQTYSHLLDLSAPKIMITRDWRGVIVDSCKYPKDEQCEPILKNAALCEMP